MSTAIAINLLSNKTRTALEKAPFTSGANRKNVENSHKVMDDSRETCKAVAEALGIDFEATEYTFTVVQATVAGRTNSIYSPYIGSDNGVACIFWGKVRKPLSEVTAMKGIETAGTERFPKLVLEVDLDELGIIHFPLMFIKDSNPDRRVVIKALSQNKLHELLAKSFEKPKSLSELAPGEYQVIGYKTNNFNGDIKYMVEIDGLGFYKCNTKLSRKLVNNPVITRQAPATLLVEESTATTSMGYPIIPVELITEEEATVEVFEF